MFKFNNPEANPFMADFLPVDTMLKDDKYKKFRDENKEWIRELLTKMIEKKIKEMEAKKK